MQLLDAGQERRHIMSRNNKTWRWMQLGKHNDNRTWPAWKLLEPVKFVGSDFIV